ncbi:hypothetical protein JYP52_21110 [Nitratireductor aquibiodomus]|uniref:hypothetical protein n=1 Tax=Nitratireductor aquibiodomus TaxID=204799 RepID=UPI0019D39661|nr:hypothetical protein [Nitratireductor aquibiodomus]MBN7763643.1 hypothetical protein [Nitratireductor aquibiodomus]
MTTNTTRPRDWAEHDAKIPYRDIRMWLLNGTNRAGRRPHSLNEPERPIRMEAANDNRREPDRLCDVPTPPA